MNLLDQPIHDNIPDFDEAQPENPGPSPFLPGTQIQFAWDSTCLGYLKTCPRLYQYKILEGWSLQDEPVHLRFGTEFHQALNDYDMARANGLRHDDAVFDAIRALVERTGGWNPDHSLKNRFNLVRASVWYMDQFESDPAETVRRADGTPAVEVSFRFELDWGPENPYPQGTALLQPYLLCGHLDRVVDYQGSLFVMDRKTTKQTPGSYFFNQFEPNNQMTMYTLAARIVLESPIKGVIIDGIQIAVGFSRFVRGITYRTRDQLEEWLASLKVLLRQAEDYASAGHWPQNDTACDKFGGCQFREICSKSPSVRQQFLEGNFVKGTPWNPLKPR